MRRVLYWLAMVLAATALVAGATYAYVGYRETSGPDGAVRGYLDALARGDASGALAFGDVPPGSHAFLTDDVLAEQLALAPMRDVHVETASKDADRASVLYSYRLAFAHDAQDVSGRIALHHTGDGWRLDSVAVPVTVDIEQAGDRFAFAGAGAPQGRIVLFPGALPIRFDTPLLQVDASTMSVNFGSPRSLDVRIEPTRTARAELATRLRRMLTACVTTAGAAAGCPQYSPRDIPGSLRGRILGTNFSFRVSSESAGPITITGSAQFVGTWRRLRYDNTVVPQRGRLALPIAAMAYPVPPLAVRFTDDT